MFKHVLLFKFIDPEVCGPVVGQKLLALKETVPEIVEIEYGLDELHKGRSYDAALIVTFKDKEGYLAYDKAPSHNSRLRVLRCSKSFPPSRLRATSPRP